MNKYRIRVENAPGYIPDRMEEESELKEGVTCSGFMLMTFDEDGLLDTYSMSGVSVMDIAKALAGKKHKGGVNILWQAFAVAEGLRKAADIKFEMDREKNGGIDCSGAITMDAPDAKKMLDILLGRKPGQEEDGDEGEE